MPHTTAAHLERRQRRAQCLPLLGVCAALPRGQRRALQPRNQRAQLVEERCGVGGGNRGRGW